MRGRNSFASRSALGNINETRFFRVGQLGTFAPVITDSRANRVFGKHGTVQFDRRQAQLLGNFRVLDLPSLLQAQAFNALGHIRRRRNRRSTAKSFKFNIGNNAVFVDTDLEFHNIPTCRCTDSVHVTIFAIKGQS